MQAWADLQGQGLPEHYLPWGNGLMLPFYCNLQDFVWNSFSLCMFSFMPSRVRSTDGDYCESAVAFGTTSFAVPETMAFPNDQYPAATGTVALNH